MKKAWQRWLGFVCVVFSACALLGASTTRTRTQAFVQSVQKFHASGAQIRILVETDKPLYRPGETIWGRVVVVGVKRNGLPKRLLRAVVTLISSRHQPIKRISIPLYRGHGAFQFSLHANARGGRYVVRCRLPALLQQSDTPMFVDAYESPKVKKKLRFMREGYDAGDEVQASLVLRDAADSPIVGQRLRVEAKLGSKFVRKWSVVTSTGGGALLSFRLPKRLWANEGTLSVFVRRRGLYEAITRPLPLRDRLIKVGFFPEGGQSIVNLPSRVYFAVRRGSVLPQDIVGVVKDHRGQVVARVRSFHDGMGRFVYTPKSGMRYALHILRPRGIRTTFSLPLPRQRGLVMRLRDDFHGLRTALSLAVSSNVVRRVHIAALQHETLIGRVSATIRPGQQTIRVPLKHRWRGIIRLTIFDAAYRPLAERLVFRRKGAGVAISIDTQKRIFGLREAVSGMVRVKGPDGKPLQGFHLGISVVDDGVLRYADNHRPGWLAQRFLTTQLTGVVHKPNFYFQSHAKAPRALDLLMGTHGWRRFSWKRVATGQPRQQLKTLASQKPKAFSKLLFLRTMSRASAISARRSAKLAPSRRERMVRRLRKKIKRKTILRWARPRNTLQDILQGGSKRSLQRAFGGARGAAIATRPGRMRGMRARGVASGSLAMPRRRMASPQIERVAPAGVRALRGSAMSAKGGGKKQQKAAVSASFFVGNIGVDVGQLDTLKMLRLIHRQRRRLLHCFRRSLKRKPSLRGGKLSLRVTLSPKGRVLAAEVEEKEIPQRAVRCIKHDIRTWRYPRPKTRGQAVVHMPFFFAPNRKKVVLVPRGYRPWSDLMHETWTYPRQFPVLFYQRGKSHYARGGSLDMRETLFWHPHLITDARGEARFRFGLNDRISSFRIGVSGVGKGLFGVATQVIRATKPLSVSAVVPMEVSRGDIVRIPVVVQSRGKSDASLRLQVGVSKSLALLSSADAEKRISLIAGAGKRFLIAVRVRKFEGKGSLVLRLKSGSRLVDQLHKEISIRPRGVLQRSSLSGVLGQGEKLKLSLKLPKVSVRGLQGAMMFDVDPLQRLREGLDSMLREPHGCFEQTSSVHATNIMLVRYLKARGFDELELYRKSYEMLRDGYERFKSFERRKGGFSAFPNVPVSAVLTARALLLLHETRRVFGGVSNVWLSRIAWWLRSRRDGKGEYRLGGGELAYLKRSSHSLAIRQAYITYALGQVGAKGITVEMELLRRRGSRSKSVQLVALALLTTVKQFGRSHPATITLHKRLKSFQQRDGLFADKVSKVAYNALFGNQHDVEATALALLGMLRVEKHSTSMLRAVRALRLRREASGAYGSTFSTALTLQALAAYETRYPARFQGSLTVKVNGKRTLRRVFSKEPQKKREGALRLNVGRSLQTGRNEIRLHSSAASAIPYVLGASYYVDAPKTSRLAPIRIQVKSSTRRASLHRQVRLTVTLQNVRAQPQSMVMAQVAFPGGLRVQRWQIEQLMKQRKVDLIETQPRKLLLYWRGMKGRERKVVSFDLLAMVPGTFTAGPSQAYLYYRNEHRAWTRGFAITVVP